MITLAWYLLKVIICSGILCGYYFLALRNKAFHRWNRFYLLAAIVISLLAPIIKINIFQSGEDKGTVVQVLQTIGYGDEAVIEYSHNRRFQLTTENMAEAAYLLISAIFLFIFLLSIYKIKRLRKKYPETKIEDVSFINTSESGTPFSFFKLIFWNQAIDLHSRSGQQIFNHEIAHVKEKHSYDKIFMNIVLIFFWTNPFFWLMRKELYMIHEFIADKEALEDSDISSFAEMILQTVYPGQHFSSTNNFFYSPIKRRILMLTKNKNPKMNYLSRLLVLPLASIVFFAFALKVKNNLSSLYDGKPITVVIDAGHGGTDNGAISDEGLKEKDITLSIAKDIVALNSNQHIKILLSRDNDQTIPVNDRVAYAKNNKADLFISIHVNSSTNKQLNGFSVLVDKQNSKQNLALGSTLINALKETYKTEDKIGVRNNGVLVLDKNICPASLIECGYLSNAADANFISNSANQEKIAKNVLDAINAFASSAENINTESSINISDTIPNSVRDSIPYAIFYNGKKLKYTDYVDNDKKVEATYSDGSKETITKEEALKRGFIPPPPPLPGLTLSNFKSNPLYVIDGKIYANEEAKKVAPKSIESINVLKDEEAIKKYGDKGKNGVIEITTKKDEGFTVMADTIYIGRDSSAKPFSSNKNFSGNEKFSGKAIYINSKFPEGTLIMADGREISQEEMKTIPPNNIRSIDILKGETAIKKYGEKAKEGAVEITTKNNIPPNTFIIIDGKESTRDELEKIQGINIKTINVFKGDGAIKKYGTKAKDGAIEIITKENSTARSVRDTIPDKVFTKVEIEAHFPGGASAWQKYITKIIVASLDTFTEKDFGTCVLKFIVNTDGKVSNVEATTMEGTNLAKIAINALRNGPNWIPASQNGHTVAAYRLQPVTLTNPAENKKPSAISENNEQSREISTVNKEDKIFIKQDQAPAFQGGSSAWLKYISHVIQKNGNDLMSDKKNSGTCEVRFIVSKVGKVSDVQATTMKGTSLADVAVNAIKKGPRWNPGMQNGKAINSYAMVPVAFKLSDNIMNENEPE